ncbi:MAG: FtsX-like permease family protein [Corynebacterium variabile]|uniref:FtsX-like permease family protein n=1 Tax=Corynebacterium variabile TaxID=1727 RepID=UPI003F8E6977
MYLAFRDIRAATGRFVLIGSVVGLVTLLIVMLTGLTAGLGKQNTSALEALHPDRFIGTTGEDGSFSFTGSSVGQDAATTWAGTTGVDAVTPLGISQTRMTASDGGTRSTGSVAVFGLPAGTTVDGATVPADAVLLPADLRGITGDATSVDLGGVDVPVASSTAPDLQYSHLPVALVDLGTWQAVAHTDDPTVLMADGSPADWDATAASTGTTALTVKDSFSGLSAYTSERGSLVAIQGLLYGISALFIVAFLSVWTIQRTRDIAVLRALGATKAYVFRDALGQAVVVVAAGVAVGALAGLGLGTVAGSMVPFSLSASTVVVPGLGVLILGVVGALVATRRVLSTDPRIAMEATS